MEARNHGIPQLRSDVQHVRRDAHQWPSTILAIALPPPLTKSLAASKSMESREPERKRPRTTFTNQQLVELELEFHIDRFLNRIRCITIAKRLAISEKKVKIWFQNRRTKYKKNALKAKDIRGVHQPAIESTSNTPIASGSITQGFFEKTSSLPLATDWPPQKKITTFADIQRAFQEFREYAKKVRELHASNQQSSSMSVEATPVKLENAAFTFKENSTTNTQPAPPPCSPSELGNNSCDDIDLSFLDHCPAPDLMAWNYSLISQDTSSGLPPFDMDLDCLNKLLNC